MNECHWGNCPLSIYDECDKCFCRTCDSKSDEDCERKDCGIYWSACSNFEDFER